MSEAQSRGNAALAIPPDLTADERAELEPADPDAGSDGGPSSPWC
jgi:hypothetical protein